MTTNATDERPVDPFPEIFEGARNYELSLRVDAVEIITSHAAILWDLSDRPAGGVSKGRVGGAIATALSLLSHRPGGVDFLGWHHCAAPHPNCPGVGEGVTNFAEHLGTGSVYTPSWLADLIVKETLDPLVYAPGPRETADVSAWRLRPGSEILRLRVADISAGSGAFLIAAAKYLALRLAEAWEASGLAADHALARKMVATHCLYGVDINPVVLELAQLALAVFGHEDERESKPVREHFAVGEALLGVDYPARFPNVFTRQQSGFDAVIGNPPWLGGHKITGEFGTEYRNRLVKDIARGKTGSADLCAYFLLRSWDLLNPAGQLGLVCTNTIAQGATRRVGLEQVVGEGGAITYGIKSEQWPDGRASVHYSAVCISKGTVGTFGRRRLVGGE